MNSLLFGGRRRVASGWLLTISVALFVPARALADGADAGAPTSQEVGPVVVVGQRRLDVPLLTQPVAQTPQSIDVIPAQVMQLDGLSDLRDVLRLDPSVSAHADEDSGQGTNVQIRGFSARFDIYRDGQLDLGQYYRDPFDLDSVEVLTGPSSVLFGRGSTGGAIDDVSKAPLSDPLQAGVLSAGTDGLARFTADINAPLSAIAAVRLNAMAYASGIAGRDLVDSRRLGISPSFSIGMGGPTELTVGFMHQSQWGRPDYGVPWIDFAGSPVSHPAPVPWHDYYGFKDDYSHVNADIATASLRHDFGDGWVLSDQLRIAGYGRGYRITEPTINGVEAPGTLLSSITVARTVRGGSSREGIVEDQADLTGSFQTWGLKHSLAVSAQIGQQTSDPTVLGFSGVPGTNLIAPDETMLFSGTSKPKSIVRFTADTAAASLGDSISIGTRWEVDGSVRIDRFAANYQNAVPTPIALQHTDVQPSYRAALLYALTPDAHAYVMWGTSFDPSAESLSLSASTADLAPERNQTIETGLKWTPVPALLLSGALFRTIQFNSREPSPVDPTLTILAGTARSEGLELLAQGRVTQRWLVLAGYTYLDAKIIASPNNDVDQPLQDAPRNNLRLFSAYDLTSNLTIGGGLDYSSSRVPASVPDSNGFRQEAPGYTTLSALIRYRLTPHLSLQINADNLLNAHYYDGLDDNHVNVGAGRSVHFTLAFGD
jgi:catecholate siderophore receptor